jgi:AraC-like DNA-binding protein
MKKGVPFPGAMADFCMASLILGGYAMGLPPMAQSVFFTHPRPRNVAKFESVFRVAVHFDAERDHAVFLPGAFDVPLPQADPVLCSLLARHADKLLERAAPTPPLLERVRRAIANELRGGLPTVGQIAPVVGIPERTLRRRLEREGVSFQGILDDMRRELALSYLEQPDIELEEAAYLLGYSEASAFRRAFKRWTGKSVTDFRRR